MFSHWPWEDLQNKGTVDKRTHYICSVLDAWLRACLHDLIDIHQTSPALIIGITDAILCLLYPASKASASNYVLVIPANADWWNRLESDQFRNRIVSCAKRHLDDPEYLPTHTLLNLFFYTTFMHEINNYMCRWFCTTSNQAITCNDAN